MLNKAEEVKSTPAISGPPLPSIRIRFYKDSDANEVRLLFKTALCVGADSPRYHLCCSELKTPHAFASLILFLSGVGLYIFSRTQRIQAAAYVLMIAGTVPFSIKFSRTYSAFLAFVNGSINGPDMVDVPTSYGMVRDSMGKFVPKGKNAFWVAEAYLPDDPARMEVVGCVGIDITTSSGENNAELRRLAVSSRYRGQGIARGLIKELIAHARTYEIESVWLRTPSSNIGALQAYYKMGWSVQNGFVEFKNMIVHVLNLDVVTSKI